MSDVLTTIDIGDLDFLSDAVTEDDISLSQICDDIEKQESVFQNFHDLSVKPESDTDMDHELYGDFNLLNVETASENMVEMAEPHLNSRFGNIDDSEIESLISGQENMNTKKNTKWAVNVFEKWREEKIRKGQEISELTEMSAESMNYCLSHFVCDARKTDGSEYPPKSLYYIICGLLRHLRDCKIHDVNFLSDSDVRFAEFRKTLDAKMKELLSKGLGTNVKQADPISEADENKIWEKGVFGSKSAETLQYTVFFYLCKLFGLGGYDEHHSLECKNVIVGEDDRGKFIQFIGGANKTFKGGLAQLGLRSKNIKHYCQPGNRCIADFFFMYKEALGNDGPFYRRPLAGEPIRYGTQLVCVNKLKQMMKIICGKAGVIGNFSNHSGKRTCATQLFLAGVDEQEIMARTGHRSEKAVRKYKRSSDVICENVSKVLDPPPEKVSKSESINMPGCEPCKKDIGENCGIVEALRDVTNKALFNNCQVAFNFKTE